MMEALLARADTLARAAQRARLEQIARSMGDRGLRIETRIDSIVIRGRGLVRQWLGDPLLRFAGRLGR